MVRRIAALVALVLVLAVVSLLTTGSAAVWPYRNTLLYYVQRGLGRLETSDQPPGVLHGTVRTPLGQPIKGARVLVSTPDGTARSAESDARGRYRIPDVPPGSYIPVAGAPGFQNTAVRTLLGIGVGSAATTQLEIELSPLAASSVSPATTVELGDARVWTIPKPLPASAVRRELRYLAGGRPNQTTLYYTPDDGQTTPLPTLLAVYPGSADTWESVSLPLAQAGFAVIAVGPAYALDLEADVDELERLVQLVRDGVFPRADVDRLGALGGSYSSLHVLRLATRSPKTLRAILLLGPPTDMFELRRQFEAGTFFPPFGLDQAFVALGLPSAEPERYFRYSARYHARSLSAPLMLIHSKQDEIVPFTQSELLATELRRIGAPYELSILNGMGHYLLEAERTPAIDALWETTVRFFERELVPLTPQSPGLPRERGSLKVRIRSFPVKHEPNDAFQARQT